MKKRIQLSLIVIFCSLLQSLSFAQGSCEAPSLVCGEITGTAHAMAYTTPVSFTNNYGCLDPFAHVAKAWAYVEVSDLGPTELVIQGNTGIGAAIWGPFADLASIQNTCGNLPTPTDCDIVSDDYAFLNINPTAVGEIYLIFVMSDEDSASFRFSQHNSSSPNAGGVNCNTVVIVDPPTPNCSPLAPICGAYSNVHYPLVTETILSTGNNYNCLDPWGPIGKGWHYFETSQTGLLQFTLESNSAIGAAIWGSFPDLASAEAACGSLNGPFTCKQSNSGSISLSVNATVVGEVFILLVTSPTAPAEFSFYQSNTWQSNAGSTNCGIVGSFNLSCADDIYLSSCNDALPTAYDNHVNFYNAGGHFTNACQGYIALNDEITYDNNGSSCPGNARQLTRQYYAADVCGNIGVCSQYIYYPESENGPIPICPATIGIACLEEINLSDHMGNLEVITDCGMSYALEVIDSSFQGGNWGLPCDFADYIYHIRATDACGRSADCELRYTLIGEAPVFVNDVHPHPDTCRLPSLTKECNDPFVEHDQLITDWIASMEAIGSCGEIVSVTTDYHPDNFINTCGLAGEQVVTFTATDFCGRTATCTGSIINVDTKPPYLSRHAEDVTVNCDNDIQTAFDDWLANSGDANGIDCCSELTWSYEPENPVLPSPCGDNNSIEVTFKASDACGYFRLTTGTFTVEGAATLNLTASAVDHTTECSDDPMAAFQTWLDGQGNAAATSCGAITWSYSPDNPTLPDPCVNNGAISINFIATDACGDSVSTEASFTVTDTEAPSFTSVPMDETGMAEATDACDDMVVITSEDSSGASSCEIIRIWTATDACGNSSTATTVLEGGDTNPPVFDSVPADATMACSATPVFGTPTASDTEGAVTLTSTDTTVDGACDGSSIVTRTWTATDACGNTTTASQSISLEDTTAPVFTSLPIDLTFVCGDPINFPDPIVSDDCGTVTLSFTDELNAGAVTTDCNNGNGYDIYRTWTATDACGNASTAMTVSWVVPVGYTGPMFSFVPENRTIGCSETPVFEDAVCETFCGEVSLTFVDVETIGDCSSETIYTRFWTGIDDCGNTATSTQVLTMPIDTEAPQFTFVPENKMITCGESVEFGVPTCMDNCSDIDHLNVSFEDIDLTEECAYQRTWTVVDACGNEAQAIQKITINDTEAPLYNAPLIGKTISCGQAFDFDIPVASDGCSEVELTFTEESFDTDCGFGEVRIRTWTATDKCGNSVVASQSIQMEDTDAPVFGDLPSTQTISCGETASFIEPTVTDACTTVSLSFEDDYMTDDCQNGNVFRRVWTATDACGNAAQMEQVITSEADNTSPEFSTTPANKVIACGETMEFDAITAVDACSAVELVITDETITDQCTYTYSMQRTWTATDACGNVKSVSQVISMEDNEAPVFTMVPESSVLICGQGYEYGEPEVVDGCSVVSLVYEDTDLYDTCNGHSFKRVWTATDACGNVSEAAQEFTSVPDNIAPVFSMIPADKIIDCTAAIEFDNPAATDVCSGVDLQFVDEMITGVCENTYSIQRTWTATDGCGNMNELKQTIYIEDNTAPVFETILEEKTLQCGEIVAFDTPVANDLCSTLELTFEDMFVAADCGNAGTHTRTWTATDACGNAMVTVQHIVIAKDETAPVVSAVLVDKTTTCGDAIEFDEPTVTDNCSAITSTFEDVEEATTCGIIYTRIWTIADACGNAISVSQKIEQIDSVAPVFTATPTDLEMTAAEYATWEIINPEATDNCSEVTLSEPMLNTTSIDCADFKFNYTWEATDACGNIAYYSLNVKISDALPSIDLIVPEDIACGTAYEIEALVNGGFGIFVADWTLNAASNWTLDAQNETPTIVADEGTAELTLALTNEYGCVAEQTVTLTCQTSNSLLNLENETGFTIAPNPTAGYLNLTFTAIETNAATIEIYDLLGQLVQQEQLNYQQGLNTKRIDAHKLHNGAYLLLIKSGQQQWQQKFIKQ